MCNTMCTTVAALRCAYMYRTTVCRCSDCYLPAACRTSAVPESRRDGTCLDGSPTLACVYRLPTYVMPGIDVPW